MFTISMICECLVDQNRYIGSDPIGYKCSRPAAHEMECGDGRKFLICAECFQMTLTEPDRIDFHSLPLGSEGQQKLIAQIIAQHRERLPTLAKDQ